MTPLGEAKMKFLAVLRRYEAVLVVMVLMASVYAAFLSLGKAIDHLQPGRPFSVGQGVENRSQGGPR